MENLTRAGGAPPVSDAKRPRTFQCRDVLWERIEQIAGELECSVDYLVNEALRHYVQKRVPRHPLPDADDGRGRTTPPSQYQPLFSLTPVLAAPRPPPRPVPVFVPPPMAPPPLRPPVPPPPRFAAPPPWPARPPAPPPPLPPAPAPPSIARTAPPPPPPLAAPPLAVIYGGQRVAVDPTGFVIGRGKRTTGLTIKDPNVSRCHAMIEVQNGIYYLVDMGSTNGVEVNGERIARKAIVEGDVARVCEHEIRFTFRRPE